MMKNQSAVNHSSVRQYERMSEFPVNSPLGQLTPQAGWSSHPSMWVNSSLVCGPKDPRGGGDQGAWGAGPGRGELTFGTGGELSQGGDLTGYPNDCHRGIPVFESDIPQNRQGSPESLLGNNKSHLKSSHWLPWPSCCHLWVTGSKEMEEYIPCLVSLSISCNCAVIMLL